MSAEEAMRQAGYATGGAIGSRAGGALTALMGSGVGFEDALMPAAKKQFHCRLILLKRALNQVH